MAEHIRSIEFTLTVDTNKDTYRVAISAASLGEAVERFKEEADAISDRL